MRRYLPISNQKKDRNFKININQKSYTKIFDKFKKKIKSGETYQIKICTKYKNKSKIDPLDFFCRLTKTNLAPEAFMIKDKNYSIISCSPENLINKRGSSISTKPIAGTLGKTKKINKKKALNFFRNNLKETKEHNMIVDMERSDLSKICKPGSVKILKKKYVEEYKHLFHYVTSIQGMLKKNITPKNIVDSIATELNWGAEKLRDDITCLALDLKNTELVQLKKKFLQMSEEDLQLLL